MFLLHVHISLICFGFIASKPALIPNPQYSYTGNQNNREQRLENAQNYAHSVWNLNYLSDQQPNVPSKIRDNVNKNLWKPRGDALASNLIYPKPNVQQAIPVNRNSGKNNSCWFVQLQHPV